MWIMWKRIESVAKGNELSGKVLVPVYHVGYLVQEYDSSGSYQGYESVYEFVNKGEAADMVHYLNGGNRV